MAEHEHNRDREWLDAQLREFRRDHDRECEALRDGIGGLKVNLAVAISELAAVKTEVAAARKAMNWFIGIIVIAFITAVAKLVLK